MDLSKLTLEQVKEISLKREYSFTSHVTLFENCAEQYRFFKELNFAAIRISPMLFGTLVHQTIEDIHKAVLRGEEHTITPEAIETWFSTNYAVLSKKERVYLAPVSLEAARRHILRYYERENGRWDRIKETEVEISLVKDHYILKGNVDLIRGENDTVEVVDFKSEKKPDMEKDRERVRQYQTPARGLRPPHRKAARARRSAGCTSTIPAKKAETPTSPSQRMTAPLVRRSPDSTRSSTALKRGTTGSPPAPISCVRDCDMRAYCGAKRLEIQERQIMSEANVEQVNIGLWPMSAASPTWRSLSSAPIKGYPMLNWRGKRPFTSTQFYPAQLKETHGEEVDGWRNKILLGRQSSGDEPSC